MNTENTQTTKHRKPVLAALLSFLTTGLGQIYNGQWQKGVLFFLVEAAVGFAVIFGLGSFQTMVIGLCVLFAINIFVAVDAYRVASGLGEYRLQPCNRAWVYAFIILANGMVGTGVELIASDKLYRTFEIPSESMLPTLLVEDHFMADILSDSDTIKRGDIVVFPSPEDPSKDFVKRVIGLPGETVQIEAKVVSIDGQPLDEPYVQHTKKDDVADRDYFGPVTLGPDEYFVMGDNREGSYDSRWIGPIKRDGMKARAMYIYFPGEQPGLGWFSRFGEQVR